MLRNNSIGKAAISTSIFSFWLIHFSQTQLLKKSFKFYELFELLQQMLDMNVGEVSNIENTDHIFFLMQQIENPVIQIPTCQPLFHLIGLTIPMMDQAEISIRTWLQGNVNTQSRRTWNPYHQVSPFVSGHLTPGIAAIAMWDLTMYGELNTNDSDF